MRHYSFVYFSAALCFFLAPFPASAQDSKDAASASQSAPWYKSQKIQSGQIVQARPKIGQRPVASNGDLEAKLTHQLQVQEILPQDKNLQDACSVFKYLDDCIASLRVSHSLQIDFFLL